MRRNARAAARRRASRYGGSPSGMFRLLNRVAGMERDLARSIETKNFTIPFTGSVSGASPAIIDLSAVPQGTTSGQRVGRMITLRNMNASWRIASSPGGSVEGIMRMILFRWDDDTPPTLDDVITPATGAYAALVNPLDRPINELGRGKFSVLQDRVVTAADELDTQVVRMYRSLGGQRVLYAGPGAGDGLKGRIFLLVARADTTTGATVTYGGFCRLRYTDS